MSQSKAKQNSNQSIMVLVVMGVITIGFIGFLLITSGGDSNSKSSDSGSEVKSVTANDGFLGDTGETITAAAGKIEIAESDVSDGDMHAFNYFSEAAGKNIYFFVVKAPDGTYRAAANACEVCHATKKGFTQMGDRIKCNNCGTIYSKDQIALEKGGCNPGPIDADVLIADGNLQIEVSDVEAVSYLF